MAPSVSSCDSKLRKLFPAERRPPMLKDFLRHDLSSCSSNGFKSLPRRECCTTVRCLLEMDLKARDSKSAKKLGRNRFKATSSTFSALQRASEALIDAVKHLPLAPIRSPSVHHRLKRAIVPSLSLKLISGSFWRKAAKHEAKIERWKTFRDFLEEEATPSDQNFHNYSVPITTSATGTSDGSSNNNSWPGSEFTTEFLRCSSGDSECSVHNEAVEGKNLLPLEKANEKRVGYTVGDDSADAAAPTSPKQIQKKVWPHEEGKEQFSPVSVLDCPFADDEENYSPVQYSFNQIEDPKQKARRFECIAQVLDPVDLDKRIEQSESDEESRDALQSHPPHDIISNPKNEEYCIEHKARELLKLVKAAIPPDSTKFKADNMLLDFFKERLSAKRKNHIATARGDECINEMLMAAECWINGQRRELYGEWEVQESRKAYFKNMEQGGGWRALLEEEEEEVALEMGHGVLACLVNELLVELVSTN